MDAMFNPYSPPEMTFTEEQLAEIVSTSDVGILTIGRNAGEGGDRVEVDDFLLTVLEQELIANTSKAFQMAGKKLIVVLNIGGVIETDSWKKHPDAILLAWQGGQEGGNSVADILSGSINPSGKLPMTFPVNLADHASNINFPQEGGHFSFSDLVKGLLFPKQERPEGEKLKNRDFTNYEEGIYVGYRHFDKSTTPVSFPFGYGLSYTDFEYSDMELTIENDTLNVSLMIKNIGDLAGKEVVQVYSEKINSKIDRPVQELRAFAKTNNLNPGESETISMRIPTSYLRYWDEVNKKWSLEKGAYHFRIGSSSRNIKLTAETEL